MLNFDNLPSDLLQSLTPPQNPDELWDFVKYYFNVEIPRVKGCNHPQCSTPFEAFCDSYFAVKPVSVWLASRGCGKSHMIALLCLTEIVTLGATINLLGGSGEQARRIHAYLTNKDSNVSGTFWEGPNAPKWILSSPPTKYETFLENGGYVKVLMASDTSVRGPHPVRLRIDECKKYDTKILTSKGEKRICDLDPNNDNVYAWDGSKLVLSHITDVRYMGLKKTIKLYLSNNRVDICTPNHLILTKNRGWTNAGNLTEEDLLLGVPGLDEVGSSEKQEFYWIMSKLFQNAIRPISVSLSKLWKKIKKSNIRKPYNGGEKTTKILRHMLQEKCRNCAEFLYWLWKKSPPKFYYLSRVLCKKTGCKKVKVFGMRKNITTSIQALSRLFSENSCYRRVSNKESKRLCRAFTKIRKYLSNFSSRNNSQKIIRSNENKMGVADSRRSLYSRYSSKGVSFNYRSRECIFSYATLRNFKTTLLSKIRLRSISPAQSIQQNGILANRNTANVRVLKIEEGPFTEVWDITVPEYHNFIAEGIVVHNCDASKLSILETAFAQPQSRNGIKKHILLSSTRQKPDGPMQIMIDRVKVNDWNFKTWCWRNTIKPYGWGDPQDIEDLRKTLTKKTWEAEMENMDPVSKESYIDYQYIESCFSSGLGIYEGDLDEHVILIPPDPELEFYTGVDIGKTKDFTVVCTFVKNNEGPDYLAAWTRTGRKPWNIIGDEVNQHVKAYSSYMAFDVTGGGDIFGDHLEVPGLPIDFRRKKLIRRMLQEYVSAIEEGKIIYPRIAFAYKEHKYLTGDMLFGKDHLPDSVAAGALAWHARQYSGSINVAQAW